MPPPSPSPGVEQQELPLPPPPPPPEAEQQELPLPPLPGAQQQELPLFPPPPLPGVAGAASASTTRFYAPWCGHCKKLEPVWHEVGAEMRSSGSPVRVGKIDATAYSSVASELGVRGYPTIKLLKGDLAYNYRGPRTKDDIIEFANRVAGLKGDLAYNYRGPRTKDDIIEFANRVAGPVVRSLPSQQMFEHVQKRHDVLFLYVGGESPLKEKYIEVASELIVYTYFFSALEEVLPKHVALQELPAVLVFKDGTYFVYDEYEDGDLSSWINKERFQGYLHIDGFTLYELEDTEYEDGDLSSWINKERFQGYLHIDGFTLYELEDTDSPCSHLRAAASEANAALGDLRPPPGGARPIVRRPLGALFHIQQWNILDSNQRRPGYRAHPALHTAQGGDGILQRIKRVIYDVKSTVVSVFKSSPLLGCFLFGLPLGVISIMCYGICTADSDDGSEEAELFKREGRDQELTDEGSEEELEDGNDEQQPESGAEHSDEEREEKTSTEKKTD
ncbi:UNVERIFIED_CONTAM: hypothetical protein FKN15_025960 [Acipenser sinensis]